MRGRQPAALRAVRAARIPHKQHHQVITATRRRSCRRSRSSSRGGRANGVELARSPPPVPRLEPHVRSVGALFSPTTGMVNAHALMDDCCAGPRRAGACAAARRRWWHRAPAGVTASPSAAATRRSPSPRERVVNAAGLGERPGGGARRHRRGRRRLPAALLQGQLLLRGPGARRGLVSRLVYPVPGHVSLGVHAVIGLEGRLRFGPDVEYAGPRPDYRDRGQARARSAKPPAAIPAIRTRT